MANIFIKTQGHTKRFDVINISLLFWPGSKIFETNKKDCIVFISSKLHTETDLYRAEATVYFQKQRFRCQRSFRSKKEDDILRFIKLTVYIACQKATGISSPWGILTGIRPMAVYEKLENRFPGQAGEILERDFLVSAEKRNILDSIYTFRKDVYYDGVENDVSLYISIPFCPSKCSYCSFVSSAVEKVRNLIDPYVDKLLWEIEQKINLIYEAQKSIASVYIGGGTPGILSAEQIDKILSLLFSKIRMPLKEFCFEIGRPETVTQEKLSALKKYPVDRLCINCQTLNDSVLEAAGRRHTAKQFIDACNLAKQNGFDCINVDFIVGLPGEDVSSHLDSLKQVLDLGVENITIHSLSIKKANTWLNADELYDPKSDLVVKMLNDGYKLLLQQEYTPYYIYRQKSTLSNGENIGYAKDGFVGKYNIYMMEDVHSVFGCGAGASTKIKNAQTGRIDRFVNTKYPQEYLKYPEKLDEQLLAIRENLKGE